MSESITLVERDDLRVVAVRDDSAHKPEWQGLPQVIIGLERGRWDNFTESWPGATDEAAILRAVRELDEDELERWLNIFADDLVNRSVLAIGDDEPLQVALSYAHGYSQGDSWMVLDWLPADYARVGYVEGAMGESELVNWARGDAWGLVLQYEETWTAERTGETYTDWMEEGESCWGYFTTDPGGSLHMHSDAAAMLPAEAAAA